MLELAYLNWRQANSRADPIGSECKIITAAD
jgi:hypothetical protein